MNTFIYSISDENSIIRYIGKANNPKKRLYSHLREKSTKHKYNWLQSIIKRGHFPNIEVIDEVPSDEWEYWEQYWISQFKAWEFKLLNITKGGYCNSYKRSNETKAKMRKSKLGIKLSEEHKQKISDGVIEKAQSSPNYNKCYDKSIFINRDELYQKYITENLSMPETAKYFNVSEKTIFSNLKEYYIIKDRNLWTKQCAKNKSKLLLQFTKENEFVKEWESAKEVERTLGIVNIHTSIKKGWGAGGFIWKYK